ATAFALPASQMLCSTSGFPLTCKAANAFAFSMPVFMLFAVSVLVVRRSGGTVCTENGRCARRFRTSTTRAVMHARNANDGFLDAFVRADAVSECQHVALASFHCVPAKQIDTHIRVSESVEQSRRIDLAGKPCRKMQAGDGRHRAKPVMGMFRERVLQDEAAPCIDRAHAANVAREMALFDERCQRQLRQGRTVPVHDPFHADHRVM